jgi:uncharacterized protein YkwD
MLMRAVCALGAASLVAAAPAVAAGACNYEDRTIADASPATLARAVRCVINDERGKRLRQPVEADARLAVAADRHAADMVERGYFEHDSPGGSTFVDRIRRTGYLATDGPWVVGEVLAWCSAECATPRGIVSAWLASPPHRRVLLDPRFAEVGVGVAPGSPRDRAPTAATVAAEFGRVG